MSVLVARRGRPRSALELEREGMTSGGGPEVLFALRPVRP